MLSAQSANQSKFAFILPPAKRLLLLMFIILFCWIVGGTINSLLLVKFGMTTRMLRVASILQSVIQIFLPAIATAVMVSRRPADLLALVVKPRFRFVVLAMLCMVAAIPMLNVIIDLNREVSFPGWARSAELFFRSLEDNANNSIYIMQGSGTVMDLVLNVLIIGVMAGVGEELLFRGAIQRLLATTNLGPHVAIWLTATLFSAIHLQFFGFVPRLLLGAFFGYLLYWSDSLWVPVAAHALNNIIYVVGHWIIRRDDTLYTSAAETIGTGMDEGILALISLGATAVLLFELWRRRLPDEEELD